MANIYANAGNVISDGRYVNRTEMEELISRRVLNDVAYGSFALAGMQRTGKSSVLHHMFLDDGRKAELLEKKIIVIDNSLASVSKADEVFLKIVKMSYRTIRKLEDKNEMVDLAYAYEDAMEWSLEQGSLYEIQAYLEEMTRLGYRLIVVMDEFDNAMTLFEKFPQCFNYLRELAYKSQYGTTYVIASRRVLKEICEMTVKGVSPFPNIFECRFLGPYNAGELERYYEIFKENFGVEISAKNREEILKNTGGIAYWMDCLVKEYVAKLEDGEKDVCVEDICEEIIFTFWNLYEALKELLEDQKLLSPLMQFEFGPIITATQEDISILQSYGIVKEKQVEGGSVYPLFSENFRAYLHMIQSSIEYAPLWNKTERGMRRVFVEIMSRQYGTDWIQVLREKYDGDILAKMDVGESRANCLRKKLSGSALAENLTFVDGLETRTLFALYRREWECMQQVFPKLTSERWKKLGDDICNARNDYAHNNDYLLSRDNVAQTIANLTLIVENIEKWEEKQMK